MKLVNAIHLKYTIKIGTLYEETTLRGFTVGKSFQLGNVNGIKVYIDSISDDKVKLIFEDSDLFLPNSDNSLEIKVGEKIRLHFDYKPSPMFTITLLEITKDMEFLGAI